MGSIGSEPRSWRTKEAARRRSLNVMDSTVTASFEDLELMSDRPIRRQGRRLRNAEYGERKMYVA
jgi:hypothetical protein